MMWLLVWVFFSFQVNAEDLNILSFAKPKRSVISGVLNPASLSFNGQEIYQSQNSFEALLLNEKLVPTIEAGGLKSFYLDVEESSIDLKWKKSETELIPILKIEYPAITDLEYNKNKIRFKFNGTTKEVLLDSEKLQIIDDRAEYKIENVAQWLNEVHVLELASDKKTSQIYNLDLKLKRSDLLTLKNWEFTESDAPFWGNGRPSSFGLGYRIQDENRNSFEYIFSVALVNYTMSYFSGGSGNSITQSALQGKVRYGYNPFETNSGEISLKRVTLGASSELIHYKRRSTFVTSVDGINADNVDLVFLQGGFFIRWEPLQYDKYGLFFCLDQRIWYTLPTIESDSTNKFVGFSYYF